MSAHTPFTKRTRNELLLVVPRHDIYVRLMMLVNEAAPDVYTIDWAATHRFAISLIRRNAYDICLVGSRVGSQTGIEFAREANKLCSNLPVIQLSDDSEVAQDTIECNKLWDRLDLEKLSPRLLGDSLREASRSVRK